MREPIEGPAGWRGDELAESRDWIHEFSPDEIREIEGALRTAKASGKTLDTLTKSDFPLPKVSKRIAVAREFLENGKGLYQFRGIRTDVYPRTTFVYSIGASAAISAPRYRRAKTAISWAMCAMSW